jgi:hypothetical protein
VTAALFSVDRAGLYFAAGLAIAVILFYAVDWLFHHEERRYQDARGGLLEFTSTEARAALTDVPDPEDWFHDCDDLDWHPGYLDARAETRRERGTRRLLADIAALDDGDTAA